MTNAYKTGDHMIKEERYHKILEIIEKEKYISAEELSSRLFVSLPTIRRDLAELQRRNQLLRSRGGAKQINTEHIVMPLDFRKTLNPSEKRKLCQKAAELVHDNDIIFIDASTTLAQIADYLSDKKSLTVVTNSIPLSILLTQKGITTYSTGGEFQESSLCYAGSYAEEFVRNFNIDLMLFSSYGISESGMILDASLTESMLRKAVMRQARKSVFLCDHTKFGRTAPYNLMPLSKVDCIITDADTELPVLAGVAQNRLIQV